jgi:peptidyl-prolyl cis-trans isomerase SurA
LAAMEARENLLRFVEMTQTMVSDAARRPGMQAAALASLVLAGAGMALGQMAAPRYQSPINAPVPHWNLPVPEAKVPGATVVEDVIVRVNDQIIDRSDVERAEKGLEQAVQEGKLDPAEFEQAKKDLLSNMIDEQLLLSRAKELDLNVDTEVVKLLDGYRKQYQLDSLEQKDCPVTAPSCKSLEQAVRESGISYEDFKAQKKNELLRQKVIGQEVGRNLHRPTLKEQQAYYDLHKQEYMQPEQVHLSEILVPTPDDPTDARIAEAQAKAQEVETKLKGGSKFEDLAKLYSAGSTADKGGDLGDPYKRGDGKLAKVLEDQVFPLQTGEATAPIRTRQGFVVLKVTEHIPAGTPPLKDVEEQVEEGMYSEAMQPAVRKYLTDLRDKAYIKIEDGFVDTAASPNETKVVLQGATPLPVKKKPAATEKQRLSPAAAPAPAVARATPEPANVGASTAASSAPAATNSTAPGSPTAKIVNVSAPKKRKKIKREKIRFGQAPRNSLPSAPEETLAAGADQGAGAQSVSALPVPGEASAPPTNIASNADLLAPVATERTKTRYSDRAATEAATKATEKAAKLKVKAIDTPTKATPQENMAQKIQDASIDLSDTPSKKKKKREKGAPKERMQNQAPTPPAAKPTATPIPPKSVRDNGEPVVSPPPATAPPPASTSPSPTTAPPQ